MPEPMQLPASDAADLSQRWRPKLSDALSAIAIVVAAVSFVISQRTQDKQDTVSHKQANQALLLQLRAEYPRISSLAEHPNGPELESALAVATSLLHQLRREADGSDFFFIGDTYRHDNFPEQAVPLYREAIARLTQPAPKIAALRGLGYAEALLENPPSAEAALRQATIINTTANYPPIVKFQNEANTLRIWVTVAETDHNCGTVLQRAQDYFAVVQHLSSPNWRQAPEDIQEVHDAMTACQPDARKASRSTARTKTAKH
jgi:tetratricopeptide (TPR) repeat protein